MRTTLEKLLNFKSSNSKDSSIEKDQRIHKLIQEYRETGRNNLQQIEQEFIEYLNELQSNSFLKSQRDDYEKQINYLKDQLDKTQRDLSAEHN